MSLYLIFLLFAFTAAHKGDFTGKVVIVTGGSDGIGAATAIAFAKEGAYVAIVGRNETKLAKVAATYPDRILPLRYDITNEGLVPEIFKRTIDQFGKLDVLVNNAGIIRQASLLEGNVLKVYDEVMNTNLRAVLQLTSLAAPHLIKTKGNVVSISGIWAMETTNRPPTIPTAISKAGLNRFTIGAAAELAPYGVRVNAISPGAVKTEFLSTFGLTWEQIAQGNALKRVTEPQEVADLILFLAGDKAKSITGSNYVIDSGGLLV